MKSLYYFNPISVVRGLYRKDVIAWSGIYKLIGHAIGMNDRSNTLKQPIRLKMAPSCLMPDFAPFNGTYDDCVDARVKELYDLSVRINKPIGIMWSGGIDSTMIVVGFLRNYSRAELKDRVKIVTSTPATVENPNFYKNHILPNFDMINSNNIPWLFDGSIILVTGELNDQLFGSDLIRAYLARRGAAEVNGAFDRDQVFSYINAFVDDEKVVNIMMDAILESAAKQGIVLEKNTDFFWWYNFCFKWQTVNFRVYALIAPKLISSINQEWNDTYMHHFYQTDAFQLWSMNHPEVRYIDDFKNYKQLAKQSIFNFDDDEEYLINKIKRPSFQTVFEQRLLCEAVTEDFEIIQKLNPFQYYNADNPFNS
jgi:hypothetical protein